MGISAVNLLVILLIVLIIFGAGKLPKIMGDLGKGLKSFKDAMGSEAASNNTENKNEINSEIVAEKEVKLINTRDKIDDTKK